MIEPITSVTLNGRHGDPSMVKAWLDALADPDILAEKSGFLFKAGLSGSCLMLAVAPVLIEGERAYHYALRLEREDAFALIGAVSANGVFTILVKPRHPNLSLEEKAEYIERFQRFAGFMLDAGYTGEGLLDEVTRQLLGSLGLSAQPATLKELRTRR